MLAGQFGKLFQFFFLKKKSQTKNIHIFLYHTNHFLLLFKQNNKK
jgi:hypothetical protein